MEESKSGRLCLWRINRLAGHFFLIIAKVFFLYYFLGGAIFLAEKTTVKCSVVGSVLYLLPLLPPCPLYGWWPLGRIGPPRMGPPPDPRCWRPACRRRFEPVSFRVNVQKATTELYKTWQIFRNTNTNYLINEDWRHMLLYCITGPGRHAFINSSATQS